MSRYNKIVIGDGDIVWTGQLASNTYKFRIQSSDNATPIVITTVDHHTIQTNDNVVIALHNGNLGVLTNSGNFVATRIGGGLSKQLSLNSSVGVNPGSGGYISLAKNASSVTAFTCDIMASHSSGAAVIYSAVQAWLTQGIGTYTFTIPRATIEDTTKFNAGTYARHLYYTEGGEVKTIRRDTFQIVDK